MQSEAYTDNPLEELRKRLPNTEIRYLEKYKKSSYSSQMLWPTCGELTDFIKDSDVVLFFAGSMESEDTEFFDRRSAHLNPNTNFKYSNIAAKVEAGHIHMEFFLKNTGEWDGSEVIQVYLSDCISTVPRPIKELKYFEKVFLRGAEVKKICIDLPIENPSYYNIMLHNRVVEDGNYDILMGLLPAISVLKQRFRYKAGHRIHY